MGKGADYGGRMKKEVEAILSELAKTLGYLPDQFPLLEEAYDWAIEEGQIQPFEGGTLCNTHYTLMIYSSQKLSDKWNLFEIKCPVADCQNIVQGLSQGDDSI